MAPLMIAAALATAAQPVPVAPGPGEVALHIVSQGTAHTPPDLIVLTVAIDDVGADAGAARVAAQTRVDALVAALRAKGIAAAAIHPAAAAAIGFVGNAAPEDTGDDAPVPTVGSALNALRAAARRHAFATVRITLPGRDRLDVVNQVLDARNETIAGLPVATLRDDAAARRAAIADAVARAKREGDDYAAALGSRVLRIVAASNAAGNDGVTGFTLFTQAMQDKGDADEVTTYATAALDVVIGPAR